MSKCNNNVNKTLIGGQAVLEGVMMRGKTSMATCVRDADGIMRLETKRVKSIGSTKCGKVPILRGFISLINSFVSGTKTLMRSAEVYGEDEPSKFESFVAEKTKIDVMKVLIFFSVLLGVILAVGLFIFLPQQLRIFLEALIKTEFSVIVRNLVEGFFKLVIFLLYVSLVGLIKDIKRTYMYHGAEHKTINAYESGKELTIENVKNSSRVHDRCGTTFLFLVIMVSILGFSLIEGLLSLTKLTSLSYYNVLRILIKVLTLPIIAGISYEILRGLAKTNSKFFYIFKLPGLLIQKITTREPTNEMIEVAIKAFTTVLEMDADQTIEEVQFITAKKCSQLVAEVKETLKNANVLEDAEAEWIVSIVLGVKRSQVNTSTQIVNPKNVEIINKMVKERCLGRPLWYVIGDTEFYGNTILVDERVLIPRPETEVLVETALKYVSNNSKVLDLCTGSGAIAISIKKENGTANVYASDISIDALNLAKQNATNNKAEITFIESDLFSNITDEFDVIISNPPYIPTSEISTLQSEVKNYEPILALDGGESGFSIYERILENLKSHLTKGGVVLFECGYNQAQKLSEMLIKSGLKSVEIVKDLEGVERIVIAKNYE